MPGSGRLNVLVTGGGTIAPVDDVRHLANASTGRLSAEIAEACLARGANVWHVHTPQALRPFARSAVVDLDAELEVELKRVRELARRHRACRDRLALVRLPTGTIGEYAQAVESVLRAEPIDVAFLAMAASDYLPEPSPGKIGSEAEELVIRCRRAPKVIRSVRDWAPAVVLVGFKLLSGVSEAELIAAAASACAANRADLTVANDQRTVREGRHTIHLVRPDGSSETLGPGASMAAELVDRVFAVAGPRRTRG
jgi:phosphopantothenate-cysteine ligase